MAAERPPKFPIVFFVCAAWLERFQHPQCKVALTAFVPGNSPQKSNGPAPSCLWRPAEASSSNQSTVNRHYCTVCDLLLQFRNPSTQRVMTKLIYYLSTIKVFKNIFHCFSEKNSQVDAPLHRPHWLPSAFGNNDDIYRWQRPMFIC